VFTAKCGTRARWRRRGEQWPICRRVRVTRRGRAKRATLANASGR
jgi:hypothetical protein